ncbi:MAG: DUF262 domain-containing protein [Candidatus Poribacteria bacterium]|nr:DUF262 domain-containing protein [Candidatus Poribacteria bacterium]
MPDQRYSVNDYSVGNLLNWIQTKEIAIPEIQRPFVWQAAKVRDFIDSLYRGYPVGYLITWKAPDVRLKDGTQSIGQRILIDGQQRVISLEAALLGKKVVKKNYKQERIVIGFHPIEERFEVSNPVIKKDEGWISDISVLFDSNFKILHYLEKYCKVNDGVDRDEVFNRIDRLQKIQGNSLGVVELQPELDIEKVTDIFVRINSKGITLNASDFAMSKIASEEKYNGPLYRKCIDYFCYLVSSPGAYSKLSANSDFVQNEFFAKMKWLENWKNDLYKPSYTDLLRVIFMVGFKRGRLRDLVALLSGRNFETRTFEDNIAEDAFSRLENGLTRYINGVDFKRFVMILESAGFVDNSMINSVNTVNFAYGLYLMLRANGTTSQEIDGLVQRWFVMSILTSRYTGSTETAFDEDIRSIINRGTREYLNVIDQTILSDTFWNVALPQQMETSSTKSPYFNVFLASQVKENNKGFLSRDITVRTLLEGQKDIHHIFPRSYLQSHNFAPKDYNQIANLVVMQKEINIAIGNKSPSIYFKTLWDRCEVGESSYGRIDDSDELEINFDEHCIPSNMQTATFENYPEFLEKRRKLMASKIRDYYKSL